MPLYIPWLTETIKKRGVRYLLHHYLGQFFEEKLTLEQLSIDIYEGKGSIKNLSLDVNGLNDELDFIPFRFLDGCRIGQISVEVPWKSLSTEACTVELEGAIFVCRLKTSADGIKTHCTESTLLSRSLMTSSMQMAEDIVTTEDDDDYESLNSSIYKQNHHAGPSSRQESSLNSKRKDANQMFDGLEMFAQLIDSVLRRTKLTARDTLFRIQPHSGPEEATRQDEEEEEEADDDNDHGETTPSLNRLSNGKMAIDYNRSASGDEAYGKPTAKFDADESDYQKSESEGTVEFFIKFFRCEEIMDEQDANPDPNKQKSTSVDEDHSKKHLNSMPEPITKLLTLEDVEMRIGGLPVSNLIGKHTIMIKFNGQKSEISIFSGSPLLAVIGHEQLKTFFKVFDSAKDEDDESNSADEKNQKLMSSEDYAKIENQLLENASFRTAHQELSYVGSSNHHHHHLSSQSGGVGGRRWADNNDLFSDMSRGQKEPDYDYHSPNSSSTATCLNGKTPSETEPSLENIEAFSCELKLPGIWLCILRDGESLPPLIKPYADSINSFQTINKYIEDHIKVPHIRFLALKVALDITTAGIQVFLGDLDISEHLQDDSMNPTLHLLHNDLTNFPMNSSRYKVFIKNNKEITVDLLTKTRIIFDPTMIDRIVYDYKLIDLEQSNKQQQQRATMDHHNHHGHHINKRNTLKQRNNQLDFNLAIRGEQFKVELLCPIPDLTPEAYLKPTQLRPQSFLFDFNNILLKCQAGKLNVSAKELIACVKTQPKQSDEEAIKFIESIGKNNDRIKLTLEPSPSNLDTAFPNEIEQALNESSMYDSIYVGQATESRIPTEAFQTKRKVVRSSAATNQATSAAPASSGTGSKQQQEAGSSSGRVNECDNEKIITPGDRQHLLDYLNQTVSSTKLSLSLHLPICEVEFEDKEQLDLIYNRFSNDFVFWQPKAFMRKKDFKGTEVYERKRSHSRKTSVEHSNQQKFSHPYYKQPAADETMSNVSDQESEVSFHSLSVEGESSLDFYDNELTCKITIDELFVKFNHQSCAAALRQEISAENLLLGVVIDVNKKPGTIISLVADNLELSTDSETVLEGNCFGDKNSRFALTARIKRPTKALKDIKLAIQLVNGLFTDFKTEFYTRFWQSINVNDEPILGFVAPKIVTELHIDILSTALSIVRDGARPALLSIDELYLTSMVMEQTSQVMIRLIADEVSLNLKRNKQGLEVMKNYVCLIDSGLIDLDVKFSQDGRLEFGVINNVITVRACQDSLIALCKLFKVMFKGSGNKVNNVSGCETKPEMSNCAGVSNDNISKGAAAENKAAGSSYTNSSEGNRPLSLGSGSYDEDYLPSMDDCNSRIHQRQMNLLQDAMNDFRNDDSLSSSSSTDKDSRCTRGDNLDELTDEDDEDSDSPPGIQTTTISERQRDPNACLLDESIPLIGDFFSEPLVPSTERERMIDSAVSFNSTSEAVDESGFFVIGDDDVGAGIIDKLHQEPVVRKLTEGPINIIENHFKMTKPRTIPEMLASSLERYVLEEMTLVVNLYGGRDFDDDGDDEESTTNSTTNEEQEAAELLDNTSMESLSIRSRAGSIASAKKSPMDRRHYFSDSSSSLKRKNGSRRKHFSESSRDTYSKNGGPDGSSLEPRVRFGEGAVNLWESLDLMSSPDFLGSKRPTQPPLSSDTKIAGGTWRQTDVCIQLTLTKVKLLYEITDERSPISWRFMLFIHDIEIKDRIHASDINKMLYEYCTESMPKRNTQMLTIKNIATINPSDGCEECDLKVSLKPLRLNIDQDTLLFLIEFFTSFGKALTEQQLVHGSGSGNSSNNSSKRTVGASATRHQHQSATTTSMASTAAAAASKLRAQGGPTAAPSQKHATSSTTTTITTTRKPGKAGPLGGSSDKDASNCGGLPTHCHTDSVSANQQQPIYIKSFAFSPDVPIRLDYHAKHLDFEQGALAGMLMGLAHLDHSELVLRRVQAKHGMRGLDRVLLFTLNSWMSDIKRNQLPSILSGVGPMHSVIQLFQGVRDLIWMPIDHYRKDRRLVRGLQRGASSFSSSTAMAAINLMNRFISIVQCTAQIAHDIVTPPTLQSSSSRRGAGLAQRDDDDGPCSSRHYHHRHYSSPSGRRGSSLTLGSYKSRTNISARRHSRLHNNHSTGHHHHHHHNHHHTCHGSGAASGATSIAALNQPRNFCEGVAVGFTILKEGFNDTARNVAVGMQAEDVRSAVGELVRQIPSTLLNPIISATEGAQNVLVGIRNQIAPDARREDQEKWKRQVRGK